MPFRAAADVAAWRVLCAVNISVFISLLSKDSTIQRLIVSALAVRCGFLRLTNNLLSSVVSSRNFAVPLMYVWSVDAVQRLGLFLQNGMLSNGCILFRPDVLIRFGIGICIFCSEIFIVSKSMLENV